VDSKQSGTHEILGCSVCIADRDTITSLDAARHQYKIRLDGIDAPASKRPLGDASKSSLSRLKFDRDALTESYKTDHTERWCFGTPSQR